MESSTVQYFLFFLSFSIITYVIIIIIIIIIIYLLIFLFISCQLTAPALECYQCSDISGLSPDSTTCRSGKLGKTTCKGIVTKCYTVKLKKSELSVVVRGCVIGDGCAPKFRDHGKYTTLFHCFCFCLYLSILIGNHHETATRTSKGNWSHEQSNNTARASPRLVQILLSTVHENDVKLTRRFMAGDVNTR